MACSFTPANTITCDECHPDLRPAEASYRLEIQKNLCADCVITHQDCIKGLADRAKWTCKKHPDKTAELFCVTHDYPICQVCALTRNHADCEKSDINDERKEREKELAELICRAKARDEELKQNDEEIQHLKFQTVKHLTMIREQVSAAAGDEKSKIVKDRDEREEGINADYDEQIRKLNEMRNEKLKLNRDEEVVKLQKIRDEQYSLEKHIDIVERELKARQINLMPGLEELAKSIRDGCMKAEILLIKQDNLMKDFQDVTRQMNEHLDVELSRERLDRVKEEIDQIKFKRSGLLGRLEGLGERWIMNIPSTEALNNGNILGFTSSNNVVLISDLNIISVVHIDGMKQSPLYVFECMPSFKPVCYNSLSDGWHVFGTKCGKLVIRDQHWNNERTIATKYNKPLIVTIDKDGMILAAENGGSSISVFNPKDGQCLHTINMPTTINDFKSMPTGDVVVLSVTHVCVFDRSGVMKRKPCIPDRFQLSAITVDLASDCVYALCFDEVRNVWVAMKILDSNGCQNNEMSVEEI
ncbi:uncharacterized protein [Diadema setosum]|uniref:uncharacterized protein n=1 Tax=Diadema setosum TaxID=31175 RepID=UPI003B3BD9DD